MFLAKERQARRRSQRGRSGRQVDSVRAISYAGDWRRNDRVIRAGFGALKHKESLCRACPGERSCLASREIVGRMSSGTVRRQL
jgi:hypothetical protein